MTAHGDCDPRFARVREVFEKHFAEGKELGAAFAVFLDGEPVVDLWDGVADRHTERPWERDTPVLAYSCTKALTATALLLQAERGLVDLTGPVAEVWPEFAVNGKDKITIEHLLTHQSGLPAMEEEVPVEEFEDMPTIAARIAGQSPIWEPGTAHGYHAITYGFLIGEVIRRVTGKSVGEVVAAEIAGPRKLELWLGAPDDVAARAARLSAGDRSGVSGGSGGGGSAGLRTVTEFPGQGPGDPLYEMSKAMGDPGSLMNRALGNPNPNKLKGGANHPVILRAGWPAMGMVATARGLAGFYRDLLAGDILKPETLEDATRRRVGGPDRVLFLDSAFGLGYMRPSLTFLTPGKGNERAFGHTGLGGSLGLGDPGHGLAMGYTMNKLARALTGSLRAYHLAEAVYDSLD
ncbi:serine hydrolase domain-containing protein [Sphaerisporangium flaviroseum]|uniref:Serine hydrolase domain-containing protein n=1 Tax=Sphaerisporangium flaviroseum TaxID=509199 RepID=A0ABP7I6A7_9ACTN